MTSRSHRGLLPPILLAGFALVVGGTQEARPGAVSQVPAASGTELLSRGRALQEEETAAALEGALEAFRNARDRFRSEEDPAGEAAALFRLGEAHESLGHLSSARDSFSEAGELQRQLGDSEGEARSLSRIGLLLEVLGEPDRARETLTRSLELARQTGNPEVLVRSLLALAQVLDGQGEVDSAMALFEQARSVSQAAEDSRLRGEFWNSLGMAYHRRGDDREAELSFRRALERFEDGGTRGDLATALANIGLAQDSLGNKAQAEDYYRRALVIAQEIGDPVSEGKLIINLGAVAYDRGDFETSIELLDRAVPLLGELPSVQAVILNNVGAIYLTLDELETAKDYFERALEIRRDVGDLRGEARNLSNLAAALADLGKLDQAVTHHERALEIMRSLKDRAGEAGVLHNLARAHSARGDRRRAVELYDRAIALRQEIGDRLGLAASFHNLAEVHRRLGEFERSHQCVETGLRIARAVGDHFREADIYLTEARLLRDEGKRRAALEPLEAGIGIAEDLRGRISGRDLRSSVSVRLQDFYELKVELLLELRDEEPDGDHAALALEVSDRAKAQSLLDALAESRLGIRRGAEEGLLEREDTIKEELNALDRRRTQLLRSGASGEEIEAVEQQLDEGVETLHRVQGQIRAASPAYAALTHPQTLAASEIQSLLDASTVLIEFELASERSHLWVVTPKEIAVFPLPPAEQIERLARALHSRLSQSGHRLARAKLASYSSRLGSVLLGGVVSDLGSKRLVIVPDGILHYVPFSALTLPTASDDRQEPLVLRHEIVVLPSASVLAAHRRSLAGREPASRPAAVFADPVFSVEDPRVGFHPTAGASIANRQARQGESTLPRDLRRSLDDLGILRFPRLPASRREAAAIARMVPAGGVFQALDFDASKDTFLATELAGTRFLHLATHALVNTRRPELSGMVLSLVRPDGSPADGFLRAYEIYNLDLAVDLVVLSGCDTALGKHVRGEGLISLTRGFLYAGAAGVVASLWSVEDDATRLFMEEFYSAMLRDALPPSAALRHAQVAMWGPPRHASPSEWAGFVLQGDWRSSSSQRAPSSKELGTASPVSFCTKRVKSGLPD